MHTFSPSSRFAFLLSAGLLSIEIEVAWIEIPVSSFRSFLWKSTVVKPENITEQSKASSRKCLEHTIEYENVEAQVTFAKSLGIYLHENLSWDSHIENISKKIACAIGAIKWIRHLTSLNILLKVHNSLVQPHFEYCNVVWGNCNKGLSEKLRRLQNRAACTLMSASYDSNLDDLFRALGKTLLSKGYNRNLS